MTTAIGYTRLSQDSDTSIDRQKRHIREYADDHGLELERIYNDGEGASGFDVERDKYVRVCERVREEDVDVVIVNSKRRLVRDFDGSMKLFMDLRGSSVEAHSYDEGHIDLSDPMDMAVETIQAASEHKSKKKEIERSKQAVNERLENGCYQGRPPKGLEFAGDGCHLQKSDEWATVEEAFRKLDEPDTTLSQISDELDVTISTLSRMDTRGFSYYTEKLETYGAE